MHTDEFIEVMFGPAHVASEIFWAVIEFAIAFMIGRFIAFRRVHKYIDGKHGITHEEGY